MLDAEWNLTEVAEVALVEVSVHNPTAVDRRVRVENRLDGPTLPPRGDGVPERGWDPDGYGGVVPAGETVRLGFASPASPAEPPVAVEDGGRVDDAAGDGTGSDRPAGAEAAVRLLGDAAPPADALPVPGPDGEDSTDRREREPAATTGTEPPDDATDAEAAASAGNAGDGETADDRCRTPGANDATDGERAGRTAVVDDGGERDDDADGGVATAPERRAREREGGEGGPGAPADGEAEGPAGEVPPPVEAWLADVERRVEHGERLTGASVVEAAAVLDDRGGFDAVEALPDRLAADEAALRALAERATALAERASGTDVPLAALRRLA